jgi:hypothetical protein
MNQECARCARPVHDVGLICSACSNGLTVALLYAAINAREIPTTIARLDRIERAGAGKPDDQGWWRNPDALEPTPLPYRHDQALDANAVHATLSTWVRHVAEERGISPGHWTVDILRPGFIGPPARRWHDVSTDTQMLGWLAGQVKWLRMRPEAVEVFDELHDCCRVVAHIIDRPAERILAGQCDCGAYLYGPRGKATITCECGLTWVVEELRRWLESQLDARLVTAAEAAGWIAYLRPAVSRQKMRNLINVWARRGRLTNHATIGGEPAYRFDEITGRLDREQPATA